MEEIAFGFVSSNAPCFARNRASSGMLVSTASRELSPQRSDTDLSYRYSSFFRRSRRYRLISLIMSRMVIRSSPLFLASSRISSKMELRLVKFFTLCLAFVTRVFDLADLLMFSPAGFHVFPIYSTRLNRTLQFRSAARTRGIPERSLVTLTLAHVGDSISG